MNILALESSAKSVGAAVLGGGKVLAEYYANSGLTHSVTLMPAVASALKVASLTLDDIDLFAVSNGPGSFTGVRIGVATLKGLALESDKPCIGISTLESIAYNLRGMDCVACAVMDARCGQVYAAFFDCENENVTRITEDSAILVTDLTKFIKNCKKPVFFVGDGAILCYNTLKSAGSNVFLAPEQLIYQRAVSVALAAADADSSMYLPAAELTVSYLRLSQAERELKSKAQNT